MRNNMTDEGLNKKFGKKGKYEITKGKGKNREVIDRITKYPDLVIDNIEWDKSAQGQHKGKD